MESCMGSWSETSASGVLRRRRGVGDHLAGWPAGYMHGERVP